MVTGHDGHGSSLEVRGPRSRSRPDSRPRSSGSAWTRPGAITPSAVGARSVDQSDECSLVPPAATPRPPNGLCRCSRARELERTPARRPARPPRRRRLSRTGTRSRVSIRELGGTRRWPPRREGRSPGSDAHVDAAPAPAGTGHEWSIGASPVGRYAGRSAPADGLRKAGADLARTSPAA